MAMLVIETQVYENYGNQWKPKGGNTYKILNVPMNEDFEAVINAAAIGYKNEFSEEYVIGWSVENDDYLSRDEELQLEYEGEITFDCPTIEYAELVEKYAE